MSFLRDVIQLDVDHYKISLATENTNIETLYLTYNVESKTFLSLEKSQVLNFQFYNGSLTSFGVQRPGSVQSYALVFVLGIAVVFGYYLVR
jgi:hypothetical protein